MFDFKGKVAVVTGAASGIGRASALAFAARGCDVVVADLNAERAAETVAGVQAAGQSAIFVRCDVGQEADIAALCDAALARFCGVNILMNNAGVLPVGPLEDTSIAEWRRTLDINLLGVVAGVQTFLPALRAAGPGQAHIVNTASFAGLIAYDPLSAAYSASKAAVVNFSENIAVSLRPEGIGVTCLCPGGVATNISEQIRGQPSAQLGVYAVRKALRRSAEEVGEMVAEAVRTNRFLLPTDEAIMDQLRDRAADPDGFIDEIIETIRG